MGIKKKHVPGCSCCGGGCVYAAADGNEYSDNFATLDPGWLVDASCSISVISGQLNVDGFAGFFLYGWCYRSITVTGTDFVVIMESQFYGIGANNAQIIFIGDRSTGGPILGFGFNYGAAGYEAILHASSTGVGGTPANGDKLTISITALGPSGDCRICYFINEELVLSATESLSASQLVEYGFGASPSAVNYVFDNFSIHNGNP